MHYQALLTLELPRVERDIEHEREMMERINVLRPRKEASVFDRVLIQFLVEQLTCIYTAFGLEMTKKAHEVLDEFNVNTENEVYLQFEDCTDEYRKKYNQKVDCIKLPDGTIVELNAPAVEKYIILDGKVFQKTAGPLKHPKRTKKAKRMKAVLECHRRKVYGDFASFVYECCYGVKHEGTDKYGYWYNPLGHFDGYQIGGRWPAAFLVKEECDEYSLGERDFVISEKYPAPNGYIWVSAARKKDIQWDVLREWNESFLAIRFNKLKRMFDSGMVENTLKETITDEGIIEFGELIYRNGQSLQEFIDEFGVPQTWKYPFRTGTIFKEGEAKHEDDRVLHEDTNKWDKIDWHVEFDEFIDSLGDDTVLVSIDCHC